MPKREFNSGNNTRARRRQSCAETLRCTAAADMVTHALMLTAPTNCKRRPTSQATSWRNYVYNSMSKVRVPTAKGVNTSTPSTTLRPSLHTYKLWRRELDLLIWETSRSAVRGALTACGPTWRLLMDAAHQRSQGCQSLNKSTTRTTTTPNSTMRTSWRGRIPPAQWTSATSQAVKNSPTSSNNPRTITILTTIIWTPTWDTKLTICRTPRSAKTTVRTTREIKCTITIINLIIKTITADSRPIQPHPSTRWTKAFSRSGLEA